MELVLGLPPMSQCDAAARPMYAAFSGTPDAAAWTHRPPRVSIDEMNAADAPGAADSAAANLSEADLAPDVAFNEILWKLVRGRDARMPPPVHAGWVRPREDGPRAGGRRRRRPAVTAHDFLHSEDETPGAVRAPCGDTARRPRRGKSVGSRASARRSGGRGDLS